MPDLATDSSASRLIQQPQATTVLPPDAGKTLQQIFRVDWLAARRTLGLRPQSLAALEESSRLLWQRQ